MVKIFLKTDQGTHTLIYIDISELYEWKLNDFQNE